MKLQQFLYLALVSILFYIVPKWVYAERYSTVKVCNPIFSGNFRALEKVEVPGFPTFKSIQLRPIQNYLGCVAVEFNIVTFDGETQKMVYDDYKPYYSYPSYFQTIRLENGLPETTLRVNQDWIQVIRADGMFNTRIIEKTYSSGYNPGGYIYKSQVSHGWAVIDQNHIEFSASFDIYELVRGQKTPKSNKNSQSLVFERF